MRRVFLVLFASLIGATMMAGVAQAGVLDFTDNFDSFNQLRWKKGDHALGRGYVRPPNVGTGSGNLLLRLSAHKLDGGELVSNAPLGYGSYSVRMKVPNAPSSITGFFLYEPPDYASEIDIEVYNDTSRRVIFSTYANGRQTHTYTGYLPFDPTAGFHTYRFDYASGYVRFYADGFLMRQWTTGLPKKSMHLYANAWFPKWLAGKRPAQDKYVRIDRIQYVQP